MPHDAPPAALFGRLADALASDWRSLARASQLAPAGDWRIWLLLAGRGFGKTRSGAEWVRSMVEGGHASRIALVAPTASDSRDVMIEGESGIMAISPPWNRPLYEPSKRRLTWPNGAIATAYSADEPERLRGPQHDAAWADELASWRYPDAWDQLQFGLRLGKDPRTVITTTPKPSKLIRDLLKREGAGGVVVTRGSTRENAANLAATFLDQIVSRYEGTRLGRQELHAELLEDVPGALWSREQLDASRIISTPADLTRIVVAVDPAVTSGEDADETGIVVCGRDARNHGFVIDDLSGKFTPIEWARRAIAAFHRWNADRIVAEVNQGGDMVEATIRSVDQSIPFKAVRASRGKVVRAEPVSALFEQGRVHICGSLAQLEDQMCAFSADFDRAAAGFSPDRVDAMVWGMTELLGGGSAQGWIQFYAAMAATAAAGKPLTGHITIKKEDNVPPAPITLRAPAPWLNYAPATGQRYQANAEGLIENVNPDHVPALIRAGCAPVEGAPPAP